MLEFRYDTQLLIDGDDLDEDEVLIINCRNLLQADFDTNEFLGVVQCINDRELSSCGNSQVLLNLIS